MRLVIVTRNMLAGGAERVLAQLIEYLNKKGVVCTLLLIEQKEHFYHIPENVEIIEISASCNNAIREKIHKYSEVRKIVKKLNPDLVLSMPEEIGIYVLLSLLNTKIPVVVSERNDPWRMPYKKVSRILRLFMYPFAKGIIFQFPNAAKYFSKWIQKKGVVLPNPLDTNRFKGIEHCDKKYYRIISAGRLEKQKNFKLLIDAFAKLSDKYPEYSLYIYGEGSERNELEKEISRVKMDDRIFLPGKTTELLLEMANSDLFVLTSDYEGVPNVIIEALAVGTPCVSTNCSPGGAASLINDGINGFLVDVGDVDGLVSRIDRLLLDNQLCSKFSLEGKKIKDDLNIENVGHLWLSYLESICNFNTNND